MNKSNMRISKEELLDLCREWGDDLSFNFPDELEGDYYDIYVLDCSLLNFDFLVGPNIFKQTSQVDDVISSYVLYTKKDVFKSILRHKKINEIYEEKWLHCEAPVKKDIVQKNQLL